MSAQHQLQMAERAQRKAQNAAKTAKRALVQMQKMQEDRLVHAYWLKHVVLCFLFHMVHGKLRPVFFNSELPIWLFIFDAHIPHGRRW